MHPSGGEKAAPQAVSSDFSGILICLPHWGHIPLRPDKTAGILNGLPHEQIIRTKFSSGNLTRALQRGHTAAFPESDRGTRNVSPHEQLMPTNWSSIFCCP